MSSSIEDRLRDAMAARAQAVQDEGPPPPLPLPRRSFLVLHARWTAPIAVAAAIVTLVAGVAVAVRDGVPQRPVAVAPAAALTPPFYVAAIVTDHTVVSKTVTATTSTRAPLGVYDSRTGRRTAELPVLVDSQVAGLGDGRTFFLAGRERKDAPLRFHRITLTPDGKIGGMFALPRRDDLRTETLDALAASPDGLKLAYSVNTRKPGRKGEVRVLDVVAEKVRRWHTDRPGFVDEVTWAGNARTLVFSWQRVEQEIGRETRLLDTSAASRDLLSAKPVTGRTTFFAARPGGSSFLTQEGGGRESPLWSSSQPPLASRCADG